jgi:hypothetical protein
LVLSEVKLLSWLQNLHFIGEQVSADLPGLKKVDHLLFLGDIEVPYLIMDVGAQALNWQISQHYLANY